MPNSTASKRSGVGQQAKRLPENQPLDQKSVTDLPLPPKIAEVERAAAKVKHRAENPEDRSAELLLEESEVTEAGISTPQNAKQTIRAGR
jgi:hypothetical protein